MRRGRRGSAKELERQKERKIKIPRSREGSAGGLYHGKKKKKNKPEHWHKRQEEASQAKTGKVLAEALADRPCCVCGLWCSGPAHPMDWRALLLGCLINSLG